VTYTPPTQDQLLAIRVNAGIAELAERMGKAQDHALLLAHCRRSGVFPARDRATLRRLVEPLYDEALEDAAAALRSG